MSAKAGVLTSRISRKSKGLYSSQNPSRKAGTLNKSAPGPRQIRTPRKLSSSSPHPILTSCLLSLLSDYLCSPCLLTVLPQIRSQKIKGVSVPTSITLVPPLFQSREALGP